LSTALFICAFVNAIAINGYNAETKILSVAVKRYIKNVIAQEEKGIDNDETKPLLKDHAEVLSDKESVHKLIDCLYNNLSKEEKDAIKKLLARKNSKLYDLKVTIEEIVKIFEKHTDEFKKGLYVEMLRLRYDTYVKQHQAANAKPALTL
ncbi:MAG: hypothetical protein IJQ55_01155, partial [Alphaproteobacteria bacterium]|nr:hypothetical protein [Alphaproteobacteria bacterium]